MLWQRRAHGLTKEERPFLAIFGGWWGGHMIRARKQ